MDAGERAVVGGRSAGGARRALLTVVIPTRNEADNVPLLLRELRESLDGIDYRVVFVDDSTDETPEVIRNLEDESVTLIHRKGSERDGGLSTAVTSGMGTFAGMSEYTCVMDADLQHPSHKGREMLELASDTDAEGGVSVGSKYLSQLVFKEARKTSDPMTGFFLVRNEAISGIQFRPTGFKILLEILVCAPELRVAE